MCGKRQQQESILSVPSQRPTCNNWLLNIIVPSETDNFEEDELSRGTGTYSKHLCKFSEWKKTFQNICCFEWNDTFQIVTCRKQIMQRKLHSSPCLSLHENELHPHFLYFTHAYQAVMIHVLQSIDTKLSIFTTLSLFN